MSTFQEFQVRVGRLVTELNTTFGQSIEAADVLAGKMGGPQAFLNALLLPLYKAKSAQARMCQSHAYAAANVAVAQAFFSEYLAQEIVQKALETSGVKFPTKAGNCADLARQLVCDGLAIQFAIERFVHPDGNEHLLYYQGGGREQSMRSAFFATAHVAVHGTVLQQTEGIAKFIRVRLLAGLRMYKAYFSIAGELLGGRLTVKGARSLTPQAHALLHHVVTYNSPAALTERVAQAPLRRLSVV